MPQETEIYCLNDWPVKVGPLKELDVSTGRLVPIPVTAIVRMALVVSPVVSPVVPVRAQLDVLLSGNTKGERFGAFDGFFLDPLVLAVHLDAALYVVIYSASDIRGVYPVRLRHPRMGLVEG